MGRVNAEMMEEMVKQNYCHRDLDPMAKLMVRELWSGEGAL